MEEPFERQRFAFVFPKPRSKDQKTLICSRAVLAAVLVISPEPEFREWEDALLFCSFQKHSGHKPSSWELLATLGDHRLANIRSLVYLLSRQLLQKAKHRRI